ncbi:hypothetical protein F4805DRAFT_460040 [Annulohypoxylon moriforme]|nr:hypothetical protein F4805DRAFT_460040 [Annulohypoxylon moriforme]
MDANSISPPSHAKSTEELLKALKTLCENHNALIYRIDRLLSTGHGNKPIILDDVTEHLADINNLDTHDLDEANREADILRESSRAKPGSEQVNEALQAFLSAFAIEDLGYYGLSYGFDLKYFLNSNTSSALDRFIRQTPKPSARMQTLSPAISRWGTYDGSISQAKSELNSKIVQLKWNDVKTGFVDLMRPYILLTTFGIPESTHLYGNQADPVIRMGELAHLICRLSGPRFPILELHLHPQDVERFKKHSTVEGDVNPKLYSPILAKGATAFLLRFTGSWPNESRANSIQFLFESYYHIQQHLRVLQFSELDELKRQGYSLLPNQTGGRLGFQKPYEGIFCERTVGPFLRPDRTAKYIKEIRISVAVVAGTKTIMPSFVITSISDHVEKSARNYELKSEDWRRIGMRAGKAFKGITTYQVILYKTLDDWALYWRHFLSEFDSAVEIKLENILNPEERRRLMLDDRELKTSDRYFEILQLLRIMTQWIDQTKDDMAKLSKDWEYQMKNADMLSTPLDPKNLDPDDLAVSENWEVLIRHHNTLVENLLKEIARKNEAIQSLRDGLFNATSVGEATKSGELSRYIYIFTIATIFYLPITFVCTFYGMHMFDSGDDWTNKMSFAISIVTISIGTYVALFGFWLNDKRRHGGLEWLWNKTEVEQSHKDEELKDYGSV